MGMDLIGLPLDLNIDNQILFDRKMNKNKSNSTCKNYRRAKPKTK